MSSETAYPWSAFLPLSGVNPDKFEVISLDVFDTLLFRAVRKPVHLFRHLADRAHMMGLVDRGISRDQFMAARRHMEEQARLRAKAERGTPEVTLSEIWATAPAFLGPPEAMAAQEVDVEAEMAFANPYLRDFLVELAGRGKRVCLISDTYFTSTELARLLDAIGISGDLYDRIFVSSERQGAKHDGRLFQRVLDHYGIAPQRLLHMGDDVLADHIQPSRLGIATRHYAEFHMPLDEAELDLLRHGDGAEDPWQAIRALGRSCAGGHAADERFFHVLGATALGPAVAAFVAWVARDAVARGVTKICPILREGATFAPLLRQALADLDADVVVEEFHLSRAAAFLPAMGRLDDNALAAYRRRRNFTLSDLVADLSLPAVPVALMPALNLRLEHLDWQSAEFGPAFRDYIQSPEVQQAAAIASAQARTLLQDYAGGHFSGHHKVAMVDYGANGSAQSWLQDCLPDGPAMVHYLMYAVSGHVANLASGHLILPFWGGQDEDAEALRLLNRTPELFETLLNGNLRTTRGYRRLANGPVDPIFGAGAADATQERRIAAFQVGVQAAWHHYAAMRRVSHRYFDTSQARRRLLDHLVRIIDIPTADEARFLGDLIFEDNGGSTWAEPVCSVAGEARAAEIGPHRFLAEYKSRWSYWSTGHRWPQGTLTRVFPDAIRHALRFLHNDFDAKFLCSDLVDAALAAPPGKVAVYGAGKIGHDLVSLAKGRGLTVTCVVDSNTALHGNSLLGIPVVSLGQARVGGCAVYLVASSAFATEIAAAIRTEYENAEQPVPVILSQGS